MAHVSTAKKVVRAACWSLALAAGLLASPQFSQAAKFDEMSLERWAKLGEADRYQLQIAEKYYRENNWLVALGEYEKFLSLYEKSEGASYAQLKWSLCQAHLRKQNTAIKDGYQSVIDYWPESPEATTSAYLIGKTYKDMGDVKLARKAYGKVLTDHPTHLVAVMSKLDLAELCRVEGDMKKRSSLLGEVVYSTERDKDNRNYCVEASQSLAAQNFADGDFAAGLKALSTSYTEAQLPHQVWLAIRTPVGNLVAKTDDAPRGLKMADAAIAFLRDKLPAAPTDDAQKAQVKQAMFYVADVQHYAGRLTEAEKVFDDLLKSLGPSDDVLGRKAAFYKAVGKRDQARTTYGRYANVIEGQSQIAYSYREEQKYLLAAPIYQDLLTRDGMNAPKWQWELASAYRDGGKYKEAIAAFRQTDRFPEDTKQMAYCHRALGEFKEALALYSQVLTAHEPSAPSMLLEIARTYEKSGQKESAIKSFQSVCKRFPKAHEASLAHAHLQDVYKINVTLGGATTE